MRIGPFHDKELELPLPRKVRELIRKEPEPGVVMDKRATSPPSRLMLSTMTVTSPPPTVDPLPEPFRITSGSGFQETDVVHVHVPGGIRTVSPAAAAVIAVRTSLVLQEAAVRVAACVVETNSPHKSDIDTVFVKLFTYLSP